MIGRSFSSGHSVRTSDGPSFGLRPGILILVLILLSSRPLAAQDELLPVFHFNRISAADGLPSNEIRSRVVRDQNGYAWIGTASGLARYDGYGCKEYRNDPNDPYSLSSNFITSLLVDSKQRLWVGTGYTGLSLYDRARDRFLNLPPRPSDSSSYTSPYLRDIIEDRSGQLWLATESGIVRVRMPQDPGSMDMESLAREIHFTTYSLGTPRRTPSGLIEQEDGTILVASDRGLIVFDPQTGSVSRPGFLDSAGQLLDSLHIFSVIRDSHGMLWVGTAIRGMFRVDWKKKDVRNYRHREGDERSILSDKVIRLVEDQSGHLWISTGRGIDRFSVAKDQCTPYLACNADPHGSAHSKFSIDNAGNLWISGFKDGVYCLTPTSLKFPHFGIRSPAGGVRPIETIDHGDDGTIWLTSHGMVYQTDDSARRVIKAIDVFKGKSASYWMPDGTMTFLDGQGSLWYCTWGLGLYRISLVTGRIANYRFGHRIRDSTDCVVQSIAQGPGDTLWVAGHAAGLMKFDVGTGKFLRVGTPWATNLQKDRTGKIWIASDVGGLYLHDPITGQTERFFHDPANPRSLSHDRTRKTYEDASGRIWVGAGNVINLWNPATSSFSHFSSSVSDRANIVRPIGSDQRGRLWIQYVSSDIVSVLDPLSGKFTHYDGSYGICGNVEDMDTLRYGRIMFVGTHGINIFHPDSVDPHRPPPPVIITRMAINDETFVPPQVTNESSLLQLPHTKNILEFEFAAVDLVAPERVVYRYRLEGLEEELGNTEEPPVCAIPRPRAGGVCLPGSGGALMGRVGRAGDHFRIHHCPPVVADVVGIHGIRTPSSGITLLRLPASSTADSSEARVGDGTLPGGASRRSGSTQVPLLFKHLS